MPDASQPRIAYLTSVYPRASDTFIRQEVQQLRRFGFKVHTFSINRPPDDQMVSEQISDEARRTDFLLAAGAGRLLAAGVLAALKHPRRMLQAIRLQLATGAPGIHARIRQVAYLLEGSLLARRMKRLGVQHVHNHIAENSAHVAMIASILTGIPYSLTVHGPGIFFHPRKWALGETIARSAFTCCISHFCRSQCMIFAPPSAWSRMHVVRCTVDPAFMTTDSLPVPTEPTLLCVARFAPEKGQLMIIEAVRCLIEQGIEVHVELAGDGPMREQIEQTIAEGGLQKHVKLLGWLDSQQIHDRMLKSRALMVSSFAEGLPVVVMEALAAGRPVVATRVAAMEELVQPKANGWIVTPGNLEELCEAIREVVEADPSKLEQMGRAGAALVKRNHNIEIEVSRLAELIRQSAGGQPCVPASLGD